MVDANAPSWLLEQGCRCSFEVLPLGRLHGQDMGSCPQRVTTHPKCPVHKVPDKRRVRG